MFGFELSDEQLEKMSEENEKYLDLFEKELEGLKLSEKTIRNHLTNANFYINNFLLYRNQVKMNEGCGYIGEFLGDYFIRKCMWSTPGNIKTTAASLKKFYKCMMEHKKVEKEDYEELCETIRDDIDDWMEDCRQFNDPEQDNPFFPF